MNGTPPSPDRTWILLCHLSALILFIGVPFGNIIAPLIIWLIKKPESAALDAHGKEVLNFQISMTFYTILAGLSMFVLVGFVLLPLVLLLNLIFIVIAAIKVSNGEFYRYPLTIRLIA